MALSWLIAPRLYLYQSVPRPTMRVLTHTITRSAVLVAVHLCLAAALSYAALGNRTPFRHYSQAEGLPHENIKVLAQSPDGRLWIGTSAGLSVFDGHAFTTISFAGQRIPVAIHEIEAMPDGSVWVATMTQGVWLIEHGQARRPFPALAVERIHRFVERDGVLYFFGTDAYWRLDLASGKLASDAYRYVAGQPAGAGVVSADIAADGSFWVLDGRLGPGRLSPDGTVRFNPALARMPRTSWRYLRFDMYGTGWVTHQQEGLYRLTDEHDLELILEANGAEHICVTPDRIAVASGHMGGLMWELDTNTSLQPLNEANGMPTDRVNCLFRDREGNTWIGTQDGLVQLVNPGVEHLMDIDGQPLVELEAIAQDRDRSIWALSRNEGLLRIAPTAARFQPVRDARWNALVEGLDGRLYALEASAWYVHDAGQWVRLAGYEGVLGGVVDAEGVGYFKHPDGLYRHEPDGDVAQLLSWHPADQSLYGHTLAPDGRLVVWANGQLLHHATSPTVAADEEEMAMVADYPALKGAALRTITQDARGRLWISLLGKGLFCMVAGDVLFVLPDIEVSRVAALNDSLTAVLAHDGLRIYDVDQIRDGVRRQRQENAIRKPVDAHVHLVQADGLLSSIVTDVVATDEALWLAHPGGVSRMPEAVMHREFPPPDVRLTAIDLNGIHTPPTMSLNLTAGDRNVGFSFRSTTFAHQHRVRYRYRLTGFDNMWRETVDHHVQYADLPAGRYRFEVQAGVGPDSFSAPVAYAFAIPLPVHRQPLVWAIAFAAMMGLLYSVHRYRVRYLVQLERTRTQIAMDLHDDIGSSLMSLSLLSSMARQRSEQRAPREEMGPILSEIGQTASTLVDSMSDIVWAIDPMHDTFQSILERLQGFTQRMTLTSDVDIAWDCDDATASLTIPPADRRNIYLVAKEAIANALKHSSCRAIHVRIRQFGEILVVEVMDDGDGFDAAHLAAEGYGQKTMRIRAERSNARIAIASTSGNGTVVTLTYPLNQPA